MAEAERVPTVDDLRVKLCYICREEESFDNPDDPPRAWTHHAAAHCRARNRVYFSGLLPHSRTRTVLPNALKCPQCGRKEFIVAAFGAGMYAVCTSYGAFAMQEFIGKDLYEKILTDDPAKWPWYAFINLPLIPLSLIGSRAPFFVSVSPLVPLLSGWPYAGPVSSGGQSIFSRLGGTPGQWATKVTWWPPSPGLVCALFPFVRTLYKYGRRRLTRWVMNTNRDMPTPRLWTVNEDGEGFLRIRMGDNAERPGEARQGAGAAAAQQPERLQAQGVDGQGQAPEIELLNDPNEDAGVAAERTIRLSGGSMGRIIGGALVLPTVSRIMGSLLLRLSPNSPILRRILAVKPGSASTPAWSSRPFDDAEWQKKSPFERFSLVLQRSWMGSRLWLESDPVWWRNALGLGLFIVTKDCLRLLHLWLAKQELESRHVKNRSFVGINKEELDLIDPSHRPQRAGEAS